MDFDATLHRSCPTCGFEALYITHDTTAYVRHDGTVDQSTETFERSPEITTPIIMCNAVGCDWHEAP